MDLTIQVIDKMSCVFDFAIAMWCRYVDYFIVYMNGCENLLLLLNVLWVYKGQRV